MWDGVNNNSSINKSNLESALADSDQLLFLRTTNSELRVRGNNSVRQWCAWEIEANFILNIRMRSIIQVFMIEICQEMIFLTHSGH